MVDVKERAWKKMQKLEKKLRRHARQYFGEPVAIVYAKRGSRIVGLDGGEMKICVRD